MPDDNHIDIRFWHVEKRLTWKSFKPLEQTVTPSVLVVSPQFGQVNSTSQPRCLKKESRECYGHPTGITISELEYSWNSN